MEVLGWFFIVGIVIKNQNKNINLLFLHLCLSWSCEFGEWNWTACFYLLGSFATVPVSGVVLAQDFKGSRMGPRATLMLGIPIW